MMPVDANFSLFLDPAFVQQVQESQLDLETLRIHYSRFQNFKSMGMKNRCFSIQDTCRINNGRILPFSILRSFPLHMKNVASFLPAAGSSTRYLQPLYEKSIGVEKHTNWILPKSKKGEQFPINEMLKLPKALYPCVQEGNTFFEMKFLEQKVLEGIEKTICIIPPNTRQHFQSELHKIGISEDNVFFLDQGPEFSTLRLDEKGVPIKEGNSLSIAPAGHGSLLKLFPLIKGNYPHLNSLFIRNIDNVVGSKAENRQLSQQFLGAHSFTLEKLKEIRTALHKADLVNAGKNAEMLLEKFSSQKLSTGMETFLKTRHANEKNLWALLLSVFQTPLELARKSELAKLYARPLNFLGQVPNSGKDRGGTPVLIKTEAGDTAVCLEMPHICKEDQDRLCDPKFATHFNPVFAAVEIQDNIDNYEHDRNSFWIFAEKQWQGKTVYYHESLLYEMLGNSSFVNLVFVEVPRSLFNPHKTLDDTVGQTLEKWI